MRNMTTGGPTPTPPNTKQLSASFSLSPSVSVVSPVLSEDCQRHGVMTAFASFDEFKENFGEMVELFDASEPSSPYETENRFGFHHIGSPMSSYDDRNLSASEAGGAATDQEREPMNIMNIAVKIPKATSDATISEMFYSFCQDHRDLFKDKKIRRLTFIVLR